MICYLCSLRSGQSGPVTTIKSRKRGLDQVRGPGLSDLSHISDTGGSCVYTNQVRPFFDCCPYVQASFCNIKPFSPLIASNVRPSASVRLSGEYISRKKTTAHNPVELQKVVLPACQTCLRKPSAISPSLLRRWKDFLPLILTGVRLQATVKLPAPGCYGCGRDRVCSASRVPVAAVGSRKPGRPRRSVRTRIWLPQRRGGPIPVSVSFKQNRLL